MSYNNTNLNGVLEINKLNSAKICELGKQQGTSNYELDPTFFPFFFGSTNVILLFFGSHLCTQKCSL